MPDSRKSLLIIACGALAREIKALIDGNGFSDVELTCLPANLHSRPQDIPDAVEAAIVQHRGNYINIFVAFADCGTGGALDEVLERNGVKRLSGPHCYATFAGFDAFEQLHDAEPGTLYLTDFLARQFETLMIKGLGIDRNPELEEMYFGNYQRLVYLCQKPDPSLRLKAEAAALRLGLKFMVIETGYGELHTQLQEFQKYGQEDHPLLARHPSASDRQGRTQAGEKTTQRALRASNRSRRDARQANRNRRISRSLETRAVG